MKNLRIDSPCNENWSEMTSTNNGAHCNKCATEVLDFTGRTNPEIRLILLENSGKNICGRYTKDQYISLNADYDTWKSSSKRTVQRAMVFSLVVVFGLTLFSCNNKQDAESFKRLQSSVSEMSFGNSLEQLASKVQGEQLKELKVEIAEEPVLIEILPEVELIKEQEIQEYTVEHAIEDVTVLRDHIMGISIRSDYYNEYLENEIVPESYLLNETIELDVNGVEFPTEFNSKVYPNPARERASLEIKSPIKQEQVVISLYDMSGKYLQGIHEGEMDRGTFTYSLNLIDLKPGMYLVIIQSAGFNETVRISKT